MKLNPLLVALTIIIGLFGGATALSYATTEDLPPPDEYGFHINSTHGAYITNEIAFYEGYLVLEDYYKINEYILFDDRGDHHTDTLLLSGDKITITSRGED